MTVKAYVDDGNYDRDLFPTWDTISGSCNTRSVLPPTLSTPTSSPRLTPLREFVLKRDGTNVQTNSACAATSGSWASPYDGGVWTAASDLDIDHMVPLKNAWVVRASTAAPISPGLGARANRTKSPAPLHGLPPNAVNSPTTSRPPSCGPSRTMSTRPRATRARTSGSRRSRRFIAPMPGAGCRSSRRGSCR